MGQLKTSPNDIMRWLGIKPIRNSDNLAIPGRVKVMRARILWAMGEVMPVEDDGGPQDAA
jgi:hypothetical protein